VYETNKHVYVRYAIVSETKHSSKAALFNCMSLKNNRGPQGMLCFVLSGKGCTVPMQLLLLNY